MSASDQSLSEVLDELERLTDLSPGTVTGSVTIEIEVDLDTADVTIERDQEQRERAPDVTDSEAPTPRDVDDGLEPAITPCEDNAGEPQRDSEGNLDHDDPDHLEWAFEAFDTISRAAEEFDVSYPTVRNRMIDAGVYEPDTYSGQESDDAGDQEVVDEDDEASEPRELDDDLTPAVRKLPRLEWLARPAEEIVDDSATPRELSEILDDVERNDSILDIHQRLGMTSLNSTKGLLWELGFVESNKTQFVDDMILEERIKRLREVAVE